MRLLPFLLLPILSTLAVAQTADVKLKDMDATENTAIYIEKNSERNRLRDPDFEIVEGKEDIVGDPENLDATARKNWKAACNEWRADMKDLNKANSILSLACGIPVKAKETHNITYKSTGSYKMKVRIREERHAPAKKK